jgi:hypothetical protein
VSAQLLLYSTFLVLAIRGVVVAAAIVLPIVVSLPLSLSHGATQLNPMKFYRGDASGTSPSHTYLSRSSPRNPHLILLLSKLSCPHRCADKMPRSRPLKKKGAGPLAGIPRQSGERSPTGNGASNNMVRISLNCPLCLSSFFWLCPLIVCIRPLLALWLPTA